MAKVHISYDVDDASFCRRLARHLEAYDHEVSLAARSETALSAAKGVSESIFEADALVPVFSKADTALEFVRSEIDLANKLYRLVLPVLLSGYELPDAIAKRVVAQQVFVAKRTQRDDAEFVSRKLHQAIVKLRPKAAAKSKARPASTEELPPSLDRMFRTRNAQPDAWLTAVLRHAILRLAHGRSRTRLHSADLLGAVLGWGSTAAPEAIRSAITKMLEGASDSGFEDRDPALLGEGQGWPAFELSKNAEKVILGAIKLTRRDGTDPSPSVVQVTHLLEAMQQLPVSGALIRLRNMGVGFEQVQAVFAGGSPTANPHEATTERVPRDRLTDFPQTALVQQALSRAGSQEGLLLTRDLLLWALCDVGRHGGGSSAAHFLAEQLGEHLGYVPIDDDQQATTTDVVDLFTHAQTIAERTTGKPTIHARHLVGAFLAEAAAR